MSKRAFVALIVSTATITAIAEWIGTKQIQLGPGKVILFPIIWAILLGGLISFQQFRPLPARIQQRALDLASALQ